MSPPIAIGVLVPVDPGPRPPPPESRPIGRAALVLARSGLRVVFGDAVKEGCITGLEAVPGGWRLAEAVPVVGHVVERHIAILSAAARALAFARFPAAGRPHGEATPRVCLRRRRPREAATVGVQGSPP